jgi:hypothetical protein
MAHHVVQHWQGKVIAGRRFWLPFAALTPETISRKQNTPALHPALQRLVLPLAGLQKLFDSSFTGRPALVLCGVRGRLHACCLGGTHCDATQVEMHGSVIGVHRTM